MTLDALRGVAVHGRIAFALWRLRDVARVRPAAVGSHAVMLACTLACVCAQATAGAPATPRVPSGASAAAAAPADDADTARREIDALIAALGASGCEFQRNGTWYDAGTARAHLQRKYDYLRKRDLAPSAERFIERAASRSSMSGKPYRVRCPGRAEQPSAEWFMQRLRAKRARSD